MASAAADIERRWHELTSAFTADAEVADQEMQRLITAYSSAGRHYHDLRHIAALLELSRALGPEIADPLVVDLAILYHDVVYDPARQDNEAASAIWARNSLTALGLADRHIVKIAAYIEATKHVGSSNAQPGPADSDLEFLLDFDLSILAAEPATYDAYAARIRAEYSIYPDDLYNPGRVAVLRRLAQSPALYRTPSLAAAWEIRARANLEREIAALEAR